MKFSVSEIHGKFSDQLRIFDHIHEWYYHQLNVLYYLLRKLMQ